MGTDSPAGPSRQAQAHRNLVEWARTVRIEIGALPEGPYPLSWYRHRCTNYDMLWQAAYRDGVHPHYIDVAHDYLKARANALLASRLRAMGDGLWICD